MSAAIGVCRLCKEVVLKQYDPKGPPVYAITGYERTRKGGGQNAVMFKRRLPDWIAHESCLEESKRGAQLPGLGGA